MKPPVIERDYESCRNDVFTENEKAWVRFLRDITDHSDPSPTLRAVQALRQSLLKE